MKNSVLSKTWLSLLALCLLVFSSCSEDEPNGDNRDYLPLIAGTYEGTLRLNGGDNLLGVNATITTSGSDQVIFTEQYNADSTVTIRMNLLDENVTGGAVLRIPQQTIGARQVVGKAVREFEDQGYQGVFLYEEGEQSELYFAILYNNIRYDYTLVQQ